jgi:hypothetical protein
MGVLKNLLIALLIVVIICIIYSTALGCRSYPRKGAAFDHTVGIVGDVRANTESAVEPQQLQIMPPGNPYWPLDPLLYSDEDGSWLSSREAIGAGASKRATVRGQPIIVDSAFDSNVAESDQAVMSGRNRAYSCDQCPDASADPRVMAALYEETGLVDMAAEPDLVPTHPYRDILGIEHTAW